MPNWKAQAMQKLQWLGPALKVDVLRDITASLLRGAWRGSTPATAGEERAAV